MFTDKPDAPPSGGVSSRPGPCEGAGQTGRMNMAGAPVPCGTGRTGLGMQRALVHVPNQTFAGRTRGGWLV
jgi:hypothetical protein